MSVSYSGASLQLVSRIHPSFNFYSFLPTRQYILIRAAGRGRGQAGGSASSTRRWRKGKAAAISMDVGQSWGSSLQLLVSFFF